MPSRHTWLRLISGLALLSTLLGAYGYLSLNRLLEREQINDLTWQGLSFSTQGIALDQLSLRHPDAVLQLNNLQLAWHGLSFALPLWQDIHIAEVQISLPPSKTPTTSAKPALLQEQLASVIALLPQRVQIDALQIELPCTSSRCTLLGDLQLRKQPNTATEQLELNLNLQHQHAHLHWHALLLSDAASIAVELSLAINQQPQLKLSSRLQAHASGLDWQGELSAELQQGAVLHSWIGQWLPDTASDLPTAPQAARIEANWQLQLPPGQIHLAQLQHASGQLTASVNVAEPWPIPTLGHLQGAFSVSAHAVRGQWLAERLSADLKLTHIPDTLVSRLPAQLHPEALQLQLKHKETPSALADPLIGRALPLQLQLTGQGPSPFKLNGTLVLANSLPWAVQLLDLNLTAASPALPLDDWRIGALKAHLQLDAYMDQQQLDLVLAKGSQLRLQHLHYGAFSAQQLQTNVAGLQLHAQRQSDNLFNWHLKGPTDLSAQLQHAQLQPQRWYWQGPINANQHETQLNGKLRNDADLQLKLQIRHDTAGLKLKGQLAELFLRSGNPLQDSFTAWPALLELNNGRLSGSLDLSLGNKQPLPTTRLRLTGKGLAGIYDRTALQDLDSRLHVQVDPQQLRVDLQELHVAQANPGIPIGPITASGSYRASLQHPTQGQLQVNQAQLVVMDGKLRLTPGQWNTANHSLIFPVHVQGLELEQLFILYPTDGLAGTGTLDGLLPMQLSAQGVTIEQGQLNVRDPGGRLQFQSERIRALGRSNPAMQLVTQSLEDFRFTILSSQVDYDQQGKLALAMRLEGQNPAIEQGRPIHFNINLEEDIPTLLASLQLTDKVSDIIKQRVQQRMLERNAQPAPTEP